MKPLKIIRWMLSPLASMIGLIAAFSFSLLCLGTLQRIIDHFFCQTYGPSNICYVYSPEWGSDLNHATSIILEVAGAALAAATWIAVGSFVSPSRASFVPWIFFSLGAAFTAFLVWSESSFVWAPVLAAMTGGMLAGRYLNRGRFK